MRRVVLLPMLVVAPSFACGGDEGPDEVATISATSATSASSANGTGDETGAVGPDDASIVDVDLPAMLPCAGAYAGRVTVRNEGTSTWTRADGFALGAVDDEDPLFPGDVRAHLAETDAIAPGETHTFGLMLVAPGTPQVVTTDWRMVREGVQWFGEVVTREVDVTCTPQGRSGPVRLEDHSFVDDGGPFVALGATMMWAAWAYRHDRPRLEANLATLQAGGFHYIRALGVVGDPAAPDYWDGREIDDAWPDYAEVLDGVTALAWEQYGLRVEWTLIGDGQVTVPTPAERDALAERFVALAQARPDAIMHLELANESWQNGFGGDAGLVELRDRTRALRDATDVLVAASSPPGDGCADLLSVYADDIADLATVHVSRDIGTIEGPWLPVWRPWPVAQCAGVPPMTSNEPIGPGASVAVEDDPERLVASALAAWISGMPGYVFHTGAGVLGLEDLATMPGVDAYAPIVPTLDGDLASWSRKDALDASSPWRMVVSVGGASIPDATWPATPGAEAGVVALLQTESGARSLALAVGILGDAELEARVAMDVEVVDVLSAQVVEARALAPGERLSVAGAGARLIRATRQ